MKMELTAIRQLLEDFKNMTHQVSPPANPSDISQHLTVPPRGPLIDDGNSSYASMESFLDNEDDLN